MKKCRKCKSCKGYDRFTKKKTSPDGYNYWCRDCVKEYSHQYNRSPEKRRDNVKARYGISLNEVGEMYKAQEGQCCICKEFRDTYHSQGGLYIDHDHKTGEIRGLLCNSCNVMLGLIKDDLGILKNAMDYLQNKKARLSTSQPTTKL